MPRTDLTIDITIAIELSGAEKRYLIAQAPQEFGPASHPGPVSVR